MPYQFRSAAGGVVLYTTKNAEELLATIGKRAGPRGVITPEEMSEALQALEAACEAERHRTPTASEEHGEREPPVPFAVRAAPFMDLLKRAQAAGKAVTWGI